MRAPSTTSFALLAFAPVALFLSPLIVMALIAIFVYEEW
jgi:hypothetical protein